MVDQLSRTHRQAQQRLQRIVAIAMSTLWTRLGHYDEADVPTFMAQALPLVLGAQQQSSALTAGYLSRRLNIPAFGIDVGKVTGAAVRNGTPPEEVYRRAFIQVWHDLGQQTPFTQAVEAGRARVSSSAAMDLALTQRASFDEAQSDPATEGNIYGYQRVASADACQYCQDVSGAYVKLASAMPLHNNCSCSLEPLTSEHPNAHWLPSGDRATQAYGVQYHGELGPVLTNSADSFTTQSEALGGG